MPPVDPDDPHCPECGEPIGATATYCMHCSTDLTMAREVADTDDDGHWDTPPTPGTDGLAVADRLTIVVGIGGGLVIGILASIVLQFVAPGVIAFGIGTVVWLGSTGHLVQRDGIHDVAARSAYGIAIVLLLVPLTVFGPASSNADLPSRVIIFLILLGGLAIPAGILIGIGLFVSRRGGPEGDA